MTIVVDLDRETEEAIQRKAMRLGISVSEFIGRLAKQSARAKSDGKKSRTSDVSTPDESTDWLLAVIDRADPDELKIHGITLAKFPAKNGADLMANLRSAGSLAGYGDPDIDSPELARQLREQAQTRDWS